MKAPRFSRVLLLAMALNAGSGWLPGADRGVAEAGLASARLPRLSPDYTGLVIPPNIAPMNFRVMEPGARYVVRLHGPSGEPIEIVSGQPSIRIPLRKWQRLLHANEGQPLHTAVSVRDAKGQWARFRPVTNTVAHEKIEPCLTYRLLGPLYNLYVDLGIYQRSLENFDEKLILHNSSFNRGCLNCHTFLQNRPDSLALHIREKSSGNPMVLVLSNEVVRVAQTGGYLAWHPSGRLLTFSANKLSLFFHCVGEVRDVFDAESDLRIYRVDSNTVVTPPAIAQTDYQETWPAWSPEGKYLYYCRAPKMSADRFREVRYDLARVRYEMDTDKWGEPETLVAGQKIGLSAAQPRVSPDGKRVLFCLSKYGNFPIYQPSSDLYVYELEAGSLRKLEINSDQADTWHSWSRSGRWVVFSSKRRDGFFTRPHLAYVDAAGTFHKPFILPQEDPAFYDRFLKNYNLPELVAGPIQVERELAKSVLNPHKVLKPAVQDGNAPAARDNSQEVRPSKAVYDAPPEVE